MKWMTSILAVAVMTTWIGVAAQSDSPMRQDKKMDGVATMGGMDDTYTGCIEAAGAGKFTLAHAVAATDAMGANSMKEPSTKKEMAMDTMKKDSMMSTTLTLSSTVVDLSKRRAEGVGHRIYGTEDGPDGQGHDGEGVCSLQREVANDGLGILLVKGAGLVRVAPAGLTRRLAAAPFKLFASGS